MPLYRTIRLVLLLALLALSAVAVASAQDVLRKALPVGPAGAVTVETDVGAIEVRVHAAREARLEVHRTVDGSWGRLSDRDILAGFAVEARPQDGGAVFEGRFRRDAQGRTAVQGGEMSRLQARFVLFVPADVDVRLQTGAGAIRVADLHGSVRAQTGSGPITIGDVGGSVTAQTASGDLTVGDVAGDASLVAASGEVRTGRVQGRRTGTR